jgi:hypothetical protein
MKVVNSFTIFSQLLRVFHGTQTDVQYLHLWLHRFGLEFAVQKYMELTGVDQKVTPFYLL